MIARATEKPELYLLSDWSSHYWPFSRGPSCWTFLVEVVLDGGRGGVDPGKGAKTDRQSNVLILVLTMRFLSNQASVIYEICPPFKKQLHATANSALLKEKYNCVLISTSSTTITWGPFRGLSGDDSKQKCFDHLEALLCLRYFYPVLFICVAR